MANLQAAPSWKVAKWCNREAPLSIEDARGKILFVLAFQMLCPGCVGTALPQALRLRATFAASDLEVVGLHTVFEHHAAQGTEAALKAFLQEYRIGFPVGIDAEAQPGKLPATMQRYGMQGTPTILLIDHLGRLRLNHFGHLEDLALGALVGSLIAEKRDASME